MLAGSLDEWLELEWLLTNGRGGFATSSLINCPTRRQHGWLIWNVPGPRLERWMLWSHAAEHLHVDGRTYLTSNFEFNNAIDPHGYRHLVSVDIMLDGPSQSIAWEYSIGCVRFRRTLVLPAGQDAIIVRYQIAGRPESNLRLQVWPMIASRPISALRRRTPGELCELSAQGDALGLRYLLDRRIRFGIVGQHVSGRAPVVFNPRGDWWYNFRYRREAEQGLECNEDLMVPGVFTVEGAGTLTLDIVGLCGTDEIDTLRPLANNLISRFMQEVGPLTREQTPALAETPGGRIPAVSIQQAAGATGSTQTITCLPPETLIRQVSRQFTIRVSQSDQTDRIGLVAGYPRLEEFCRDACVSVPGLLLEFGRYEEARELLLRLALLRREGALPSHWCEDPDAHEYVNADTALWFIWAVDHYLHRITASDESSIELLKASSDIVEALMDGRREGIHLDDDGLLVSDDVLTASTWMDARHAWKFSTPRLGKPVEVNALWYNALCVLAERLDDTQPQAAGRFREAARRVLENFQKLYWNPTVRGLYDVIGPNGPDPAIRPNQILAVSVRHSPLDQEHQAAVVRLVQERLLTPMGLRTLSSDDPNYHGAYEGTIEQRERAAHQGSVYAWLLGPFVEAYLRVHGDSAETRATAREFVLHVMGHLTGSGCIVGINELFDGNAPHRPRGCITQAWSVAEIARAWAMTSPLDRPVPWTSIEPSDPSNHMDETSQTGRGHPAAVPFRTADRVLRKPR